ncbi:HD family phosphohydrolase [Marinicrinis sediminis]|uniref:HD family phosphohydrolase n=1 Tax=Marinicrinis sediminis TaxID=1652465 RepID=A0ABW5RBE7_9BACL
MFAKVSGKSKWTLKLNGWQNSIVIRSLFYFILVLLFFFTVRDSVIPPTYNIEVNTRSETSITVPKKMEDGIATEKARAEAKTQVQDVYTTLSIREEDLIESVYDKLEQINGDEQFSSSEKVEIYLNFFPTEYLSFVEKTTDSLTNRPELKAEAEKKMTEQQYRIPEEIYFKFPRVDLTALSDMEQVTKEIVNRLTNDPLLDATNARAKVAELVNASELTSNTARELVQEISRYVIVPNRFYDDQATREAKEAAGNAVATIYVEQGEEIVAENELITQELYNKLEYFGLLDAENNYWSELGLLLVVLLLVSGIYMFNRQSDLNIRSQNPALLMLLLIYGINIIGMKIVYLGQNLDYPYIGFLAPVAVSSMLITILLNSRLAIVSVLIFSVLSSMLYSMEGGQAVFDFRFGYVTLVVGLVAVFTINRASQRSAILKAGMMISLFSIFAVVSLILLDQTYTTREMIMALSFSFASGLLTAVLVIGLLPFFEVSFGILSPLRLVELSNPNHPLLRKLLTETPGTYHHSVMVGNLAEAAAEAIGANGLLCRVGSFYHDIGKTKRPSYFIENQVNMENPHNHIEPSLSKSIIVAHARDGVDMLEEYKIPKQISDIAEQHHGTTLLGFFYHKAMKQQEELPEEEREEILESDYRYPGPKAQTKEAAIVGISDCVEAAVRSLRNPTIEHIDSMVDKIIKSRLEDGQFNECDLTLRELDMVGRSLKESLLGIFHSRIEYPELPKKPS